MIIEIDDKEIEVDEDDLSSLLEMLNKQARANKKPEVAGRVEQLHSLLALLVGEDRKADPTPIMIAHFETALKKVSKELSAAIKSIPQPKDPIPHPKEMMVKMADNAIPKVLTSIESMIDRMSNDVVSAVRAIPVPSPQQSEIVVTTPTQEPVKRIVVGSIERNNSGLIKSCVLEVER
jgi:hypothetical protein